MKIDVHWVRVLSVSSFLPTAFISALPTMPVRCKVNATVNIAGLAVGIAAFMLRRLQIL